LTDNKALVNIAARRTLGASWRARRDRREGVEMQRQLHFVDRLPERLPARVPHWLHVPRTRRFKALEADLGDAMNLLHREFDAAAIGQAGEADLAVRIFRRNLVIYAGSLASRGANWRLNPRSEP